MVAFILGVWNGTLALLLLTLGVKGTLLAWAAAEFCHYVVYRVRIAILGEPAQSHPPDMGEWAGDGWAVGVEHGLGVSGEWVEHSLGVSGECVEHGWGVSRQVDQSSTPGRHEHPCALSPSHTVNTPGVPVWSPFSRAVAAVVLNTDGVKTVQNLFMLGQVMDPWDFILPWFYHAERGEVQRDNMRDLIAYAGFYCTSEELQR